jgi:hypothetical protein
MNQYFCALTDRESFTQQITGVGTQVGGGGCRNWSIAPGGKARGWENQYYKRKAVILCSINFKLLSQKIELQ